MAHSLPGAKFPRPLLAGLGGCIALAVIGHQFGLFAWLLVGAGVVMGLLAWRLYEMDGPEPIRRILQGSVVDPFGHRWLIGKILE